MSKSLGQWAAEIATWRDRKGFETSWDNMVEKLFLVISEAVEAGEALRTSNREGFREEIADTFIRLLDICGSVGIDAEAEIAKKMAVNEGRPPKHGKAF